MDAVDQELRIENRMLSDTLADTKQELAQVKVSLAESRSSVGSWSLLLPLEFCVRGYVVPPLDCVVG